jgi:hypothetical protein
MTRTRAAASSIANGNPSKSLASASIDATSSGSKSRFADRARATNSAAASDGGSEASVVSSPGSQDLAGRHHELRSRARSSTTERLGRDRATCSKLSSSTRQRPHRRSRA